MATPLDAAAASAQFVGLAFQVFQGCINAYRFGHDMRQMAQDGDLLRTRMQAEKFRLLEWAKRSGIESNEADARLNWHMVYEILLQQERILTSGEHVKRTYNLRDITEEEVHEEEDYETRVCKDFDTAVTGTGGGGLSRLLRALRPELFSRPLNANPSSSSNGMCKKLRWAAVGKDKLSKIVDDLGRLNGELERQLHDAEQRMLQTGMQLLLREMLSRATTLDDVVSLQRLIDPLVPKDDHSLLAAASFKRVRLYLRVDRRSDELMPAIKKEFANSLPRIRMLKLKKLMLADKNVTTGTVLATFSEKSTGPGTGSTTVLVEWRSSPDVHPDIFRKSMEKFALLLKSVDASFSTLPCKGLVTMKEPDAGRFGLVYELPDEIAGKSHTHCKQKNLLEDYTQSHFCPIATRLRIASHIAEAVCQLHTAGWLHKNIRSENIVFFSSNEVAEEALQWTGPYLMGYENVRPDSIEAAQMLTVQPNASLINDLYRHPDKRGTAGPSFQKRFDMYALGCVLVELALWKPIVDVLSALEARQLRDEIAQAERENAVLDLPSFLGHVDSLGFVGRLSHHVSVKYIEAVKLCFIGLPSEEESSLVVTVESSVQTQSLIMEKLRQCEMR